MSWGLVPPRKTVGLAKRVGIMPPDMGWGAVHWSQTVSAVGLRLMQ